MELTKEGMSLDDIDKIVHDYIVADDAYPSAIDFMHFPKSVCTTVNDQVSHGVPNSYVLKDGDTVNIDIVCYKDGHHGDNSGMVMIGDVHPEIRKLSEVTRQSMFLAIEMCKPGVKYSQIGTTITDYAHAHGYEVNEEFGGHGIAHHLHMPPLVHHHKAFNACHDVMQPGMAFTIEPILMMQPVGRGYVQWRDGWAYQLPNNPSA